MKNHLNSLCAALLCCSSLTGFSQNEPVPAPTPVEPAAVPGAPPGAEMNENMRKRYGITRRGDDFEESSAQRAARKNAEQQERNAEKQAKKAKQAAEAGQLESFFDEPGPPPEDLEMVKAITANIFGVGSQTRTRSVLVGSFSADQLQETEEDMTVMSRIIEKAGGKPSNDKTEALGIVIDGGKSSRTPNSIYLEGYGAIFFLKVSFPLVPPPDAQEEKTNRKESTNWEQAKKELYGSKNNDWQMKFDHNEPLEYKADKVADLQENLIHSLKDAVNIRGLQGEDKVTVIVSGPPVGIPVASSRSKKKKSGDKPTTMTVQVSKNSIEQMVNGKLDPENFRKKLKINTY